MSDDSGVFTCLSYVNCIAIGLLLEYIAWVKLLFTVWVTIHLFCLAVLGKNLKKLEVVYIVTSLLVPTGMAIIPLVTHSYGLSSDGTICYIYANTSVALIERLALWDAPAMFTLIATSTAMIVMVIKLASQLSASRPADWLLDTITTEVTLTNEGEGGIVLSNGLISRSFLLSPDFGTVDFYSFGTDASILRAISPEAVVTLDGEEYNVGGLLSSVQPDYFNRTDISYQVDPTAFHYVSHTTSQPVAPFHWEPGLRHSPSYSQWPPQGLTLQVQFGPPAIVKRPEHANVIIVISYEMYVGIPLMSKWVSILYSRISPVRIDSCVVELLATQKPYAPSVFDAYPFPWEHDNNAPTSSWLYVETTIAHDSAVEWSQDSRAQFFPGSDQPYLTVYYSSGPGVFMAGNSQGGGAG
ncbi:hypothetical protein EMCRGX_G004513 [Ephydatia muelleri]